MERPGGDRWDTMSLPNVPRAVSSSEPRFKVQCRLKFTVLNKIFPGFLTALFCSFLPRFRGVWHPTPVPQDARTHWRREAGARRVLSPRTPVKSPKPWPMTLTPSTPPRATATKRAVLSRWDRVWTRSLHRAAAWRIPSSPMSRKRPMHAAKQALLSVRFTGIWLIDRSIDWLIDWANLFLRLPPWGYGFITVQFSPMVHSYEFVDTFRYFFSAFS